MIPSTTHDDLIPAGPQLWDFEHERLWFRRLSRSGPYVLASTANGIPAMRSRSMAPRDGCVQTPQAIGTNHSAHAVSLPPR